MSIKKRFPLTLFILTLFICRMTWAMDNGGNFALPPSQQPGPLFSFGQNVNGKNILQLQLIPNQLVDSDGNDLLLIPVATWGATENLTLIYSLPVALDFSDNTSQMHSRGLSDLSLAAEYQFFSYSSSEEQTQGTLMGQLTLPSGSINTYPATGLGTESLFIGATGSMMSQEWYVFLSPGIYYFLPHKELRLGVVYLFEAGLGKNIYSVPNQSIFSALLEVELYYSSRDEAGRIVDRFTGGQFFALAPSLYWANKDWGIQAGIQIPVQQQWRQTDYRQNLYASVLIQRTFQG